MLNVGLLAGSGLVVRMLPTFSSCLCTFARFLNLICRFFL